MAYCTKCGASVPDGVAFCSSCGQPVGSAAAAPPQQAPIPAPSPPPQYQAPATQPITQPVPQYQAPAAHSTAQVQGKQAVDVARKGFGAIVARMGLVTLIATVFVWIAWFFLTGFTVSLAFFGAAEATSSTMWDALGLDPTSNMAAGSHGFLSFVVLLFILLPLAAAFIPHPLAKFLYAAPLVAWLLAWATVEYEFSHMLSLMKAQMGDIPAGTITMSTEYGAYLTLLASLAVAARIFTAPRA